MNAEEAKNLLGDVQEVHVFLNPNSAMLIGADWDRKAIDKLLDSAEKIEIGGDQCRAMKHPLAVFSDGRWHFLECELPEEKTE